MSTSWIVRSVALVAIASAVVIEPVISAPSPVGTIEAPTTGAPVAVKTMSPETPASAVDFSSTFSYSYEPWNDDDDYAIPTDGQACSNGIRGVESDNGKVCCVAECGSCGGVGCSRFSPELEADDCCVTEILEDGEACSVWGEAPCFIDGQSPVPSPIEDAPTSTSPTDEVPICSYTDFNFAGYEGEQACCSVECGTCESEGCEDRPGGPDACCPAIIDAFGDHCDNPDTTGAPCYLFEKFNDGDMDSYEPSLCSNGFPGYESSGGACCSFGCGTCGGAGCSQLRGGADACCTSNIFDAGELCSEKGYAPCVVG